ncbi:MAG: flagellar protein export ATPase FliI [Bacillota bacterium]|nr:flagellar protein export ATPase FliI [Bacillota bacterium]
MEIVDKCFDILHQETLIEYIGKVKKVLGVMIETQGPLVEMGEVCRIYKLRTNEYIEAEVVGFAEGSVIMMPLGNMKGVAPGCKVVSTNHQLDIKVGDELLGRVLDGLGNPLDGLGKINTKERYESYNEPPNPLVRNRIKSVLPLGIKAIDGLITVGKGQRIGIFAGSGVGKSTLMGMIARNTEADVNVIALIGERGREVREFIEKDLGPEGLKRSVLVVATSDKPALVRVKAALLATSIAEYFRDKGKDVALMMDSLTRFSMAQREIGLAVGEPPVSRGYTPSVFAAMPKLLERAGNSDIGSITGLYTVLVEGDDFNEPISDTARGILDGHIMLTRELAAKGHYPAIDVLHSISRVMPEIVDAEHLQIVNLIKSHIATYKESEDLIIIGAYEKGSDTKIDLAIEKNDIYNEFLTQLIEEKAKYEDVVNRIKEIVK